MGVGSVASATAVGSIDGSLEKIRALKANPFFLESVAEVVKRALVSQSLLGKFLGYRYDETAACFNLKLSAVRLSVHVCDEAFPRAISHIAELQACLAATTVILQEMLKGKYPISRRSVLLQTLYETALKKYSMCPVQDLKVEELTPGFLSSKTEDLFACFGPVIDREKIAESLLVVIAKTRGLVERVGAFVLDSTRTREEKRIELANAIKQKIVRLIPQRKSLLQRAAQLQTMNLILKSRKDLLDVKVYNRSCLLYTALRNLVHERMDLGLLFLSAFRSTEAFDAFFTPEQSVQNIVRTDQFFQLINWIVLREFLGRLTLRSEGEMVTIDYLLQRLVRSRQDLLETQNLYKVTESELITIAGNLPEVSAGSLIGKLNKELSEFTTGAISDELNKELSEFATGAISDERIREVSEARLAYLEELVPRLITLASS